MAVLTDGTDRSYLALDGVSCTACHPIEDVDLGTDASFSGGYNIRGQGQIYGPHGNLFSMPMIQHTGFTPLEGDHVLDPGLCATCHTLEAHTLDAAGAETGDTLWEQGPYLEWAPPSDEPRTCQACHLPTTSADGVPISTAIARNSMGMDFPPVDDRSPYGQHLLVGGNTLGPRLFQTFRSTLNPAAPDAALDATIAAARESLASAATVEIAGPRWSATCSPPTCR